MPTSTDRPSTASGPGRTGRTGPRTEAGKARSSRNALRHGLAARRDTPQDLARHADAAIRLLAGIAGGRGNDPVPDDLMREILAALGSMGTDFLARALAFVAADEQLKFARRAKREALLATIAVLAFDALLQQSYDDLAKAADRHAHEGLDRLAAIDMRGERNMEQLAHLMRSARKKGRGRSASSARTFGAPTAQGAGCIDRDSAAVLNAIEDIVRLDRYEARAFTARSKALRRLRPIHLVLADIVGRATGDDEPDIAVQDVLA